MYGVRDKVDTTDLHYLPFLFPPLFPTVTDRDLLPLELVDLLVLLRQQLLLYLSVYHVLMFVDLGSAGRRCFLVHFSIQSNLDLAFAVALCRWDLGVWLGGSQALGRGQVGRHLLVLHDSPS